MTILQNNWNDAGELIEFLFNSSCCSSGTYFSVYDSYGQTSYLYGLLLLSGIHHHPILRDVMKWRDIERDWKEILKKESYYLRKATGSRMFRPSGSSSSSWNQWWIGGFRQHRRRKNGSIAYQCGRLWRTYKRIKDTNSFGSACQHSQSAWHLYKTNPSR